MRSSNSEHLEVLCAQLAKAVKDEGRVPAYHRAVLKKHRAEWPVLWTAIDAIIKEMEE
jgi:hypothetical protein